MLNFMKKSRGSISIFLCLILLPMVTYSSMIIDATRLQSARTTISSAGDLTMNSALSEYEQILEDMYGLFAVAQGQDEEEFKKSLANYYKQTIESQLRSGDTSEYYTGVQKISQDIVDMIFSDTGATEDELTNFLEMEVQSFDYDTVADSALANPAVMKRQIIDYMKYKGPVSLVSTLFSKLDFIKNSAKQAKVVENKAKYTEKLRDVGNNALLAYYDIAEGEKPEIETDNEDEKNETNTYGYNYYGAEYNLWITSSSTPPAITAAIDKCKDINKYMTISRILFESAHEEDSIKYDNLKNACSGEYISYDFSSYESDALSYDTDIDATKKIFNEIISKRNELFDPGDGKGEFENNFDSIKCSYSLNSEDYYSSTVSTSITQTAHTPFYAYPSLSNIASGGDWYKLANYSCNFSDTPEDVTNKLKERYDLRIDIMNNLDKLRSYFKYYQAISDLCDEYKLYYSTKNGSNYLFNKLKNKAMEDDTELDEDTAKEQVKNDEDGDFFYYWREYQYTLSIRDEIKSKYDDSFKSILTALNNNEVYKTAFEKYVSQANSEIQLRYLQLDNMKTVLGQVISHLDDVITDIDKAEEARQDWADSIGDVDSNSTQASMQSDYDTTTEGLKKEDAESLKGVMDAIKGNVETMMSDLESIKYLDEQIIHYQFTDNSIIHTNNLAAGDKTTNLSTTVDGLISAHFDSSGVTESNFQELRIIDGDEEDEKLYLTLMSMANPVGQTGLNTEQQNDVDHIEDYSDPGDDAEEEEADEPEEEGGDDGEDFAAILESIKNYSSYNDKSDSTPEEYSKPSAGVPKDDGAIKDANPSSSLSSATSVLTKLADIGTSIRDAAYLEEYFTEMFTCRTDALDSADFVLLNGYSKDMINTDNPWFGKEIEYIIWGDPTLKNNLVKNDALIFLIRFALNAIYAFTAADIQSFTLEIATAIVGWIPVAIPIVQACITVALALAESAWDLKMLHQGKDVPIYKNAKTFVCSPSGFLANICEELLNEAIEKTTNLIEDKLDEAIDSLGDKVNGTISDCAENVTGCIDEFLDTQAEAVKSTIEDKVVIPIINKITPIASALNSAADQSASAIQTMVNNTLDDAFVAIEGNINAMNDGVVKDLTMQFFQTKAQAGKSALSTKLQTYFSNLVSGTSVDSIHDTLTGDSGIITGWIDDFKGTISAKMNEYKDKMLEEISGEVNKSAGDLKSYMHDQMNSVAGELSGAVSDALGDSTKPGLDTAATSGGFCLNYKEYCKIFVLMNVAVDETKMIQRSAALIQANVRHSLEDANDEFEMINANTLVSVKADVKLGTLFPWAVSDSMDDAGGDESLGLDLTHLGDNYITVDYSGMNGY